MTGKSITVTVLICAILSGAASLSVAQSKSKNKSKALPTKQKAVHHVKRETGGRILDVKQRLLKSGANVWRVKFLKEGRIQFMDVPPQTSSE